MTLADLVLGSVLTPAFQLVFDAGFRKGMSDLSSWFDGYCSLAQVKKVAGAIKACAKSVKPLGAKEEAPAKVEKKEDDLDDLFGDDDDADEAAAAAAAIKEKAKAKKKKEVIAMSLVMLEVKPMDDTVNLDDLAKKLFSEITQDGLFWKTEYKKEPVAFGIFKLIVGFSLEDEKVSVDGVVERIEELEDLVQSVEISAFNKI